MEIIKNYIDLNPWSRVGRKRYGTKKIVLHNVVTPMTLIHATRDYFNSLQYQNPDDKKKDRYASTHYAIGLSKILSNGNEYGIVQMMGLDEKAYHVGSYHYTEYKNEVFGDANPNNYCIGIEMQRDNKEGYINQDTRDIAVQLVSNLCIKYDLNPMEDVVRHFDITGKRCPQWFTNHPDEWLDLRKNIYREVSIIKYNEQSGIKFYE